MIDEVQKQASEGEACCARLCRTLAARSRNPFLPFS